LFFTNISPPLSLWARSLWVTEVDEPHNRPPAMLGHGSAVRESILGHGSAARKICWVTEVQHENICWVTEVQHENRCWVTEVQHEKICWVTENHRDSPPRRSCRAKSPPAFWRAVLFRAPV
jgi:hypothetical protein